MKKKQLPPTTNVVALFPSFLRFITEFTFSPAQSKNIKVGLVSLVSIYLLGLIFLQSVVLYYHFQHREFLVSERTQMEREVTYWQKIADKYQGYRDVYYRIASIQYSLGNIQAAQMYIKKALDLDPNFPEGRVLGAKVGVRNE